MNLGIDITFLNTLDEKQGVHRYAMGLIDELSSNKDLNIQIYTNEKVYYDAKKRFSLKNIQIYKIKKNYFLRKILNYFLLFFGVLNIYLFKTHYIFTNFLNKDNRELIETKSQVVLFLNAQEIAYNFQIKTIINFHDLLHKRYPNFLTKKELILREYSYYNSAKNTDYLIASSLFMKKEFLHFYKFLKKKQIILMREGINKKLFNFKKSSKIANIKEKNFLFYPAQLWKHKNHILLLEAFKNVCKKNDKLKLILCGSKKNNYSKIDKYIKKNDLNKKVKYLGNISQAKLLRCYEKSLIVILPSLYESSSLVALEAVKMKKPIICSNIEPMMEIKHNFKFIFFKANSSKSLMNSIRFALQNKKKLKDYTKKNFKNLNNFTWKKTTAVLKKKIYN